MKRRAFWDGERLWPEGKPSAPEAAIEEPDSGQIPTVPKSEVKPVAKKKD